MNDALEQFALVDPRRAELVNLRFFAGPTLPEVVGALAISPPTAERGWACARARLSALLRQNGV